jgi:NAD(P)-dependent dehydrogenase (short-subunit alcohol dehydrogenase family)
MTNPPARLEGKVAFITGAGSGIGRATALRLSAEGAKVILAEINDEAGAAVAGEVRAAGGDALFVHTDVADADSVAAAFEAATVRFGRLDILHNNAGGSTAQDKPVTECDPEQFWRVVRLNLFGVWLGCHYGIPALIRSGGGSVINMASGMAIEPMAGRDAYTAAKGGVVSLTRSMALEYAAHHIRVNALAPGFTASERIKAQLPMLAQHQIELLHRVNPLGLGKPENVAAFVAFLASDEARYTSGQIFQVNNELRGI